MGCTEETPVAGGGEGEGDVGPSDTSTTGDHAGPEPKWQEGKGEGSDLQTRCLRLGPTAQPRDSLGREEEVSVRATGSCRGLEQTAGQAKLLNFNLLWIIFELVGPIPKPHPKDGPGGFRVGPELRFKRNASGRLGGSAG